MSKIIPRRFQTQESKEAAPIERVVVGVPKREPLTQIVSPFTFTRAPVYVPVSPVPRFAVWSTTTTDMTLAAIQKKQGLKCKGQVNVQHWVLTTPIPLSSAHIGLFKSDTNVWDVDLSRLSTKTPSSRIPVYDMRMGVPLSWTDACSFILRVEIHTEPIQSLLQSVVLFVFDGNELQKRDMGNKWTLASTAHLTYSSDDSVKADAKEPQKAIEMRIQTSRFQHQLVLRNQDLSYALTPPFQTMERLLLPRSLSKDVLNRFSVLS